MITNLNQCVLTQCIKERELLEKGYHLLLISSFDFLKKLLVVVSWNRAEMGVLGCNYCCSPRRIVYQRQFSKLTTASESNDLLKF